MDPALVPRVQKYLENNIDKSYVDINTMADDLQRNYREYGRRKRSAFRAIVKKAYGVVLQSYGLDGRDEGVGQDNTSSDEDDDDVEEGISDESSGGADRRGNPFRNNQLANQQIVDLYSRPQIPKRIDENELIDVSSDDSEPGVQAVHSQSNSGRIGNGPSTSQNIHSIAAHNVRDNPLAAISTLRRGTPTQTQRNTPLPVVDYNMAGGGNNMRGKKRKASEMPGSAAAGAKMAKKKKSAATLIEPSVTLQDVGGIGKILPKIVDLLMEVAFADQFKAVKGGRMPGILLHGPRGCGKTLMANAIAGHLRLPLLQVTATQLVGGVSGESEERIRDLFERASSYAGPCVLFIDEIDAIAPNRENSQKDMSVRIVSQLIACLDGLAEVQNRVLVIGATNRPDAIDPGLRVGGRFDKELCLGVPDKRGRAEIFKILSANVQLGQDVDIDRIVQLTPGYVGADLKRLIVEAMSASIRRSISTLFEQKKLEQAANNSKQPSVISTPAQKKANSIATAAAERASSTSSTTTKNNTNDSDNNKKLKNDKDNNQKDVSKNKESDKKENDSNISDDVIINDDESCGSSAATEIKMATATSGAAESAIVVIDDDVTSAVSTKTQQQEPSTTTIEPAESTTKNTDDVIVTVANKTETSAAVAEKSNDDEVIKIAEDAQQILEVDDEDVQEVEPMPVDDVVVNSNSDICKPEDAEKKGSWRSHKHFSEQHAREILNTVFANGLDHITKDNSQSGSVILTMDDFLTALKDFKPALQREGFAQVPDVTWNDVGSLTYLREELQKAILNPIQYSENCEEFMGKNVSAGILLVGPPGCGKTLVAKAVANEAEINFLLVNGPELINMYVGETEKAIRVVFERARNSAPCVLFFDELDGICRKRSDDADGGVMSRMVNQMLVELDGVQGKREGVYVLAATNRPDVIDPAVKRPGRFGRIFYLGLPSPSDRVEILKAITKNGTRPRLAPDVDLELIGTSEECHGYTGADLGNLVDEAAKLAFNDCIRSMKDDVTTPTTTNGTVSTVKSRFDELAVTNEHFRRAQAIIQPSVSEEDRKRYEKFRKLAPGQNEVEEMELS